MTSTRALIISGGDVTQRFDISKDYGLIIAVDGGLAATDKLGVIPDVIIGDFDTVDEELLSVYEQKERCKIVRMKPEKDDTDTEAAVRYAMDQGICKIDLLGGTGSRFDHTMANMFLLKMAHEQGVEICIYNDLSKIYVISGKKQYRKNEFYGKYISFIQFDGSANGVTMHGFKYDVNAFDFDTSKTYRLGISNELCRDEAWIEIKEGYMLVVESLEDKKE